MRLQFYFNLNNQNILGMRCSTGKSSLQAVTPDKTNEITEFFDPVFAQLATALPNAMPHEHLAHSPSNG